MTNLSLMNCQMIRVISSPSSSTTVPVTLIFAMVLPSSPLAPPVSDVDDCPYGTSVLLRDSPRASGTEWVMCHRVLRGEHGATPSGTGEHDVDRTHARGDGPCR